MEYLMKKIICHIFALLVCALILFPQTVQAASKEDVDSLIQNLPQVWPEAPSIASEAGLLLEPQSGTILFAKNATDAHYPASTTKLMTALLTLEHCSLDEVVTFSSSAVLTLEPGSSHIGLRVGEQLTVKDSLYGLLLPSANEVANGLAEHVAGSTDAFAAMMNERAAQLGAVNTHFSNPHGLHDDTHYTCAYDLALIMKACIQIPSFVEIDSAPTYVRQADSLLNKEIPMGSTHKMMRENSGYYDPDVICGKTGWTQQSGRCLVTYAERDGLPLICVVMKSEDPQQYEDTKALLEYGFSNFKLLRASVNDPDFSQGQSSSSPLKIPTEALSLVTLDSDSWVVMPDSVSFEQLDKSVSESGENGSSSVIYRLDGYPLGSAVLRASGQTVENNMFLSDSQENALSVSAEGLFVINVWIVLGGAALLALGVLAGSRIYILQKKRKEKARKKEERPRYRY